MRSAGGIDRDASKDNEPGHQGVLFPGGIRTEFIKGAFTTINNVATFDANPHYHAGAIPNGYFDLVVTPWNAQTSSVFPNSKIHVTPAGEPIGDIARRYKKGTEVHIVLKNGVKEPSNFDWYVNGTLNPVKDHKFTLSSADQVFPVVVVYPDPGKP